MPAPDEPAAGHVSGDTTRQSSHRAQGPPRPDGHRRNPLTSTPTGGRLLSASQLGWFLLWPPRGFGVIAITGRRSGKRRRRCIRVVRVGHTAYLTAIGGAKAQWLRNLRANPTVSLRMRGGTFEGVARTLRRDEVDTARQAYCETVHPFDRAEYVMHMRGRPTPQRIKALHEYWFTHGEPVAVDLAGTDRVAA
jgi:deazaflavin-dependent oxidoreductase (nitroreductase family)